MHCDGAHTYSPRSFAMGFKVCMCAKGMGLANQVCVDQYWVRFVGNINSTQPAASYYKMLFSKQYVTLTMYMSNATASLVTGWSVKNVFWALKTYRDCYIHVHVCTVCSGQGCATEPVDQLAAV